MKSIMKMQSIENNFNFTKKSNIKNIISSEMDKDNRYWKDYYSEKNN